MPFPGMDPYLEHPVLWEGLHARLIVALANQVQPRLDPRYVTSIDERVFIEDNLEIHQGRIEILDAYNDMRLVAIIELVSPTNKLAGPGRESYVAKQQEASAASCHLIEIDLLRRGTHVLSIPDWRAAQYQPYDYLVCISRWPNRNRFALYPRRLRDRLPRIKVPLVEPDPDVPLDLQAALEQVYVDGRYARRVRYEDPCEPALTSEDQAWACERWADFKAAHPEWFPTSDNK